jgi:ATP-dependent protease ClpP protease subunit
MPPQKPPPPTESTPPTPQTAPPAEVAASVTPDVYAIFCGEVNFVNSQKLTNTLTIAINGGVQRIHLLFHSFGGYVGDGIYMYNLFRSLPIELIG